MKIRTDFTAKRHVKHELKLQAFYLLTKGLNLSIRRQKACSGLCATAFSAKFDHLEAIELYEIWYNRLYRTHTNIRCTNAYEYEWADRTFSGVLWWLHQ